MTVFAAEAPHNVLTHYGHDAEAILVTLADAMAGLGSFSPGQSFLVLAPEHVRILARDGWTKPRLREALYARPPIAGGSQAGGQGAGPGRPGRRGALRPPRRGPQDIFIVVGGGGAGGHSAFIPSWSRNRNSLVVTHPVR